ncbi:MAG: hypothetical protein KF900_05165 [Bacteroidetes bacterium]|nr:hypothetical protein [Bacteroidota bacterium]
MKHILFLAIFLCLYSTHKAQLMDSIGYLLKQPYSIDARLESRNSFIDNQLISVSGARLGLSFQRKLKLGIGVSWLASDVKEQFQIKNSFGKDTSINRFLKFMYVCYYADFVFYKTKRWQLSVPIQVGTGVSWFQRNSVYSFKHKDPKYFLLLYEPGVSTQFKVFRWFGVGADIAYRFTMKNNEKVGEKLMSPTYSFKILFWFDQLFYELFPKHELTQRFGPAYW